jgi:hypothetical protein
LLHENISIKKNARNLFMHAISIKLLLLKKFLIY